MRILAVITARGGSKRLPGKNIRPLSGRPLIAWSIDAARGLPDICDILVSTDDAKIAQEARTVGASVPWLRPAELSGDTASSVDVCLHALDWYEREHGAVDGLLLLQPTSPFRRKATIARGLAIFAPLPHRPVVSVSPAASHPLWCYHVADDVMTPYIARAGEAIRSQDLPPAHVLNGALYLIRPDQLRMTRTFCPPDVQPLVMETPWEGLDIDTPWDWFVAKRIAENMSEVIDL
ncbi:MAG TPA: acylneuraminate cytidylyltransferase family protein [Rhodocyclaceae bacterium]|jgi:CMP-N-acetylneuraminic acid synthetase